MLSRGQHIDEATGISMGVLAFVALKRLKDPGKLAHDPALPNSRKI